MLISFSIRNHTNRANVGIREMTRPAGPGLTLPDDERVGLSGNGVPKGVSRVTLKQSLKPRNLCDRPARKQLSCSIGIPNPVVYHFSLFSISLTEK